MSSPQESVAEIRDHAQRWRSEHRDLPVTLLILTRLRRFLHPKNQKLRLPDNEYSKERWTRLRITGEKFARRRALFTAAEAIGRRPHYQRGEETASIRGELGVVLEEGTSGQKVRALRALRFIASDDCIPLLETALSDESRWVQTSALHTLFRLDLQKAEPRRVLESFLRAKFRQSLRWSWDSLAADTLRRNFNRNAGLFIGLLKERGGLRPAFLTLALWITSTVLLCLVPLTLLIVGLFCVFFIAVPLGIIALPLVTRSIYKRKKIPFWKRIVAGGLDYLIVCLAIFAGLHYQFILFGVGLGLFVSLLLCSWPANIDHIEGAERFRKFNRLMFTGIITLLSYRAGLPFSRAFLALVVIQFFWVFPRIIPSVVKALYPRKQKFVQLFNALKWCAKQSLEILNLPHRLLKRLQRISPMATRDWIVTTGSALSQDWQQQFRIGTAQALNEARVLKVELPTRVRKKIKQKHILYVLILIAVSAALLRNAELLARGKWLLDVKPFLYLVAGFLILVLPCLLSLFVLFMVFDEGLIVDRVRLRILSQRKAHPIDKPEQFLGFVFELIRNPNWPVSVRARAALNLAQVPELSNEKDLAHLLDLAAEDLPLEVRDAIEQSAVVAEDRLRRGQIRPSEIDFASLNQEVQTLCVAGPVLQPKIERTLQLAIGCSILACLAQLFIFGVQRQTDIAALLELILGLGLISSYLLSQAQKLRRWILITGLILITVGITHPLQGVFFDATSFTFLNFGLEFIDSATVRALFFPTILACLISQLGNTLHLLRNDTITVRYEEGSTIVSRWSQRMANKPPVLLTALCIAIAVTVIQSEPLQEYLDMTKEGMPTFVSNGVDSKVQLESIPSDGRVVRVALVRVEREPDLGFDGEFPSLFDTAASKLIQDDGLYTPSVERTFPPVYKPNEARNNAHDIKDTVFFDELWLRSESGALVAWEALPPQRIRCIGWSSSPSGGVVLDPQAHCTFTAKARFLAIVYNKKRSATVRKLANSVSAFAELTSVSPTRNRVFSNTLSPLTRVTWSPILVN